MPETEFRIPPMLKRKAMQYGTSPYGLVRQALEENATLADAARMLGVTEDTFRKWRRRVGAG